MKNIKFSIIVPIYNVEEYLSECLDSILNQTYDNYEVICVNDASTDSSNDILLDYAKRNHRIIVVNNEKNEGLAYSRNKGLEISQGEYVFFVDSDDYMVQNALSVLVKVLEGNDLDILCFDYEDQIEGKSIVENNPVHVRKNSSSEIRTGQKWFVEAIKNQNLKVMSWCRVFKNQFLKENNLWFYNGLIHEDELFCIETAIKAKRVLEINKEIYIYRRREGSLSIKKTRARIDSYVVIINEVLTLCKTSALEEGMAEAVLQHMEYYWITLKTLLMYFPEHKKLSVGKPEDQFLFDFILYLSNKRTYQYIRIADEQLNYIKQFDDIIVYGAGHVSSEFIQYANDRKINILNIAVSDKSINEKYFSNMEIKQIDELLDYRGTALVVVAVIKRNQKFIEDNLKRLGFKNIYLLDADRRD